MATTHFLAHDKHDTVGVVVTEDVRPGMELTGWVMETNETIKMKALDVIPLGHKIALKDIAAGETVIKYGQNIGRATQAIPKGRHAHVQNMKTERW